MHPERSSTRRLSAPVLVASAISACTLIAFVPPAGASQGPGTGPTATAAKPALERLALRHRRLALTLACRHRVSVVLRRQRRDARCLRGRGRVKLRLGAGQARQLAKGRELRLAARVSDSRGTTRLPLRLSLPVQRGAARVAASGGVWPSVEAGYITDGAKAQCVATHAVDWSGQPAMRQVIVESNYARFGYPVGTRLRWTAWLESYNPANGALVWFKGYSYNHVAAGGRGAAHVFYNNGSVMFYRPAIEIVGGSWHYARIEAFTGPNAYPYYTPPTTWCYMHA